MSWKSKCTAHAGCHKIVRWLSALVAMTGSIRLVRTLLGSVFSRKKEAFTCTSCASTISWSYNCKIVFMLSYLFTCCSYHNCLHMTIALACDCTCVICAILTLRTIVAQSRDCATTVRNLEIGTQSRDSENAQHNLEIAQIPRLRGTYP